MSSTPSPNNKNSNSEATLEERLGEGLTKDSEERVCTVDEHNTPTPHGHLRKEMRLKKLWHRATYIIIRHDIPEEEKNNDKEGYLLVQRRSMNKDYCPGKLDPCPGGVVEYGESYETNVIREVEEEMGISVPSPNASLRRLFTFPYEDSNVHVWGDLWEVLYTAPDLNGLKIQEEEVDEVLRLSISQIQRMAEEDAESWMPDGLHALRLYLQYVHDQNVSRKLLRGYSSGNLDAYALRPKTKAIFFDCDDCLYFDGWKVANHLTHKIEQWCTSRGLPPGEAYQLYKKYGTALRGLLAESYLPNTEQAIDDYLKEVHDLPIQDLLSPDPHLRQIISSIDPSVPKYIFTASVRHHAENCLLALGIHDLFVDIIDVKACNLATKHSPEAFHAAMTIAGITDPESCILLDDNLKNINAARQVGWRSVLVGRVGRDCGTTITSEHAEHEIEKIHDFPTVYPELFPNYI